MTSNRLDVNPLSTNPLSSSKSASDPANGLMKLVLALAQLIHELMERQSLRRIDDGTLTEEEIDRLGLALYEQAQQLEAIRVQHGLSKEDLNLDLGPVGKLF